MAVVIPIIASFASATAAVAGAAATAGFAAGTIGAAMSTVSGFLSVAGAALTTIGAVTGKKDLVKIGGFMALAGGIGTAMNAASAATEAGTAGTASSAWDAAGSAAGSDAAQLAKYAQPVDATVGNELLGAAAQADTMPPFDDQLSRLATERVGRMSPATEPAMWEAPSGEIAARGASLPSSELQSLLKMSYDKAGSALRGVGDFARNNKELVSMGGNMLSSMYGPEAEYIDFKKSIYNRQMNNLNNPIKLTYNRGRG